MLERRREPTKQGNLVSDLPIVKRQSLRLSQRGKGPESHGAIFEDKENKPLGTMSGWDVGEAKNSDEEPFICSRF